MEKVVKDKIHEIMGKQGFCCQFDWFEESFDVRHTYGFTTELSRLLREYENKTTNLDAEVVGNIYQNPELGEIHKRNGSN